MKTVEKRGVFSQVSISGLLTTSRASSSRTRPTAPSIIGGFCSGRIKATPHCDTSSSQLYSQPTTRKRRAMSGLALQDSLGVRETSFLCPFIPPNRIFAKTGSGQAWEKVVNKDVVSAGGWSTTFIAAIDNRINASFPIAGSTPCALRNPVGQVAGQVWTGGDAEDFEQNCSPNPSEIRFFIVLFRHLSGCWFALLCTYRMLTWTACLSESARTAQQIRSPTPRSLQSIATSSGTSTVQRRTTTGPPALADRHSWPAIIRASTCWLASSPGGFRSRSCTSMTPAASPLTDATIKCCSMRRRSAQSSWLTTVLEGSTAGSQR